MEWLLIALAGGGGAALFGRRFVRGRKAREAEQEGLDGVRRLVEEDLALLGEQLRRLHADVSDLDDEGCLDYHQALDDYEAARQETAQIRRADEVSKVTATVSSGRYALACVQARLASLPLPEHRVPCFFNPQHGPSARDVLWTSPRHGTHTVPACAADAARVAAHERPEVRRVKVGGQMLPYWEAGVAYLPYGEGHFRGGASLIGGYAMDWAFGTPVERVAGNLSRRRWAPGDFSGVDHVARGELATAEAVLGLANRRRRSAR